MSNQSEGRPVLRLLGSFGLTMQGQEMRLSRGSQRVLAFLALRLRPTDRALAAGTLWPWNTEDRAQANLRTALWYLSKQGKCFVDCGQHQLALNERVSCDVRSLETSARGLVEGHGDQLDDAGQFATALFATELLPGWDEEWLVIERERLRQLQLLALDALAAQLIDRGRLGEAVLCAMVAVTAEPLRESSQRALVAAHLANGNFSEARRQFGWYVDLLRRELNVAPSRSFAELVAQRDPSMTRR